MRPRALSILCPALLLLAMAWSLSGVRAPLPAGDEATSVMMVQSLWHDHDLAYRPADLDRAGRIWDGGPAGLTLFSDDGGRTLRYGAPLAYPLAALPFYALLGVRGIALFNMALFLTMAIAALWTASEETGAPLFVAGFFLASAALAYAFRLEPMVFLMACGFFPLLVWQRLRTLAEWRRGHLAAFAGAGLLLGAAVTSSPLLALLGVPVLIDLGARRRWRGLAALAAAVLLTAGLLALVQCAGTGEWSAFGGAQRRSFDAGFPFESSRDLWQEHPPETASPDLASAVRLLPRNLGYALAGRSTGLLPYFPFALFALALYLLGLRRTADRSRHLLAASLLIYVLLVLLAHPHDFAGASGFLGSRYLALVDPAFFFLPGRARARWSLALPYAVAGLWTAVVVAGALPRPDPVTQPPASLHVFQRLPLELTLLPGDHLPGFAAQTWNDAVWLLPRWSFFTGEHHPHGVWVRGGTRSEVVVVSPKPLARLAFTAYSLSPGNVLTLDGGGDRLTVRFDTEGKRNGTPVELAVHPVARDLGFFPRSLPSSHELFYRFTLDTSAGLVPARVDPRSHDPRDLGVFLDFTGEGP